MVEIQRSDEHEKERKQRETEKERMTMVLVDHEYLADYNLQVDPA